MKSTLHILGSRGLKMILGKAGRSNSPCLNLYGPDDSSHFYPALSKGAFINYGLEVGKLEGGTELFGVLGWGNRFF